MISEETCAVRLGLTRVVMASMRREHLVEGDDWTVQNRRVMITETGQGKLLEAVGIPRPEQNTVLPENDKILEQPQQSPVEEPHQNGHEVLSAPEPAEVTLIISSLRPPRNTRIIEATRPGETEVLRVRVRNNANFMPGMEIRARRSEDFPDVYVLVGRTPRYRGRW